MSDMRQNWKWHPWAEALYWKRCYEEALDCLAEAGVEAYKATCEAKRLRERLDRQNGGQTEVHR
jgi:hypothetical protein